MNKKYTLILLVLAIVLSIISFVVLRQKDVSFARAEHAVGTPVFKNIHIGAIKTIKIVQPGSDTIVLRKQSINNANRKAQANSSKYQWTIENAFNYPANASAISDFLRELSDLTTIQNVKIANSNEYQDLNLLPPISNKETQAQNPQDQPHIATSLQFYNGQGKLLYSLLVGKKRFKMDLQYNRKIPMGRYIKIPSQKNVWLTDELLSAANFKVKAWLFNPNISINNIKSVEQLKSSKTKWTLTRKSIDDPFKLDNSVTPDEHNVKTIINSLNNLKFDSVVNPKIITEKTGLNNPTTLKISTFDNSDYELKVGKINNQNYYVKIKIITPGTKTPQNNTETQQKLYNQWTYMIGANRVEPFLQTNNTLQQKNKKRPPSSNIYSLPIS